MPLCVVGCVVWRAGVDFKRTRVGPSHEERGSTQGRGRGEQGGGSKEGRESKASGEGGQTRVEEAWGNGRRDWEERRRLLTMAAAMPRKFSPTCKELQELALTAKVWIKSASMRAPRV
jgi:hypothetical protein